MSEEVCRQEKREMNGLGTKLKLDRGGSTCVGGIYYGYRMYSWTFSLCVLLPQACLLRQLIYSNPFYDIH